jgi:hypothetical protein
MMAQNVAAKYIDLFMITLIYVSFEYDSYIQFIYSLFNDTFSVTQTIQRRMKGWQVNDELERMCKEAFVAWFWRTIPAFAGGTE